MVPNTSCRANSTPANNCSDFMVQFLILCSSFQHVHMTCSRYLLLLHQYITAFLLLNSLSVFFYCFLMMWWLVSCMAWWLIQPIGYMPLNSMLLFIKSHLAAAFGTRAFSERLTKLAVAAEEESLSLILIEQWWTQTMVKWLVFRLVRSRIQLRNWLIFLPLILKLFLAAMSAILMHHLSSRRVIIISLSFHSFRQNSP